MMETIPELWWMLHVDETVNNEGAGAGIVRVSPEGHNLMSAIHFLFQATNNDVEYETLIDGLKLAVERKVKCLVVYCDLKLVVSQV